MQVKSLMLFRFACVLLLHGSAQSICLADDLQPLRFNHPGLAVDLGVGLWAWPLPMDFDEDGDLDLVVSCPDKPYNGVYFFENPGGKYPVFRRGKRFSKGLRNVRVSNGDDHPRVFGANTEFRQFRERGFEAPRSLGVPDGFHTLVGNRSDKTRANQWSQVDFDGDGALDIFIGIGDWSAYGWDDAFNDQGEWTNGPLHGFVYIARNSGSNADPRYENPIPLIADGKPVDVYGWPSPNLADFDGDGDLDLLCGEFLDGFTYFENVGNRTSPMYAAGRRLRNADGTPLKMDLQMIVPTAIDWDKDGDIDLIVGDEDGRVALVEHEGTSIEQLPVYSPPRYFQQEADLLKCGALSTPYAFDWDNDGDEDIICGNTAGYIELFENLGFHNGTMDIRWDAPRRLEANGQPIRIQAGDNGSIQGPCEAKWGYTTLTVGDWNHDGKHDIVANSIWGKIVWFENIGSREKPILDSAKPVQIGDGNSVIAKPAWNWWDPHPGELVTQWRTTPVVVDMDGDGLNDLVMLDHEGYLALYRRSRDADGELRLQFPERVFVDADSNPIRLNERTAGGSGRRKLSVADWDGDGRLDVLVNSSNADWFRNASQTAGQIVLTYQGQIASRPLSSHTTSPATCDFNSDGKLDLLLGAEDGHLYHLQRGNE